MTQRSMTELVNGAPIIVCCGPGGVGKTTVSASLALAGAMAGRRACVLTVDPARRLADALGIASLSNTPTLVTGDWPGTLHAVMLDSEGTFNDLISRYASSEAQVQSIRANRLYKNLASSLGGTQEYMAMEKLYELATSGDFDIVVVDTPPTRNALDLLDAPGRLTSFLENRLFRALLMPTKAYFRAVSIATQALLRTISKVAGAELVTDAVAFFEAFAGMEEGFAVRAKAARALLAEDSTAFVVVTSPRQEAIDEATFFTGRLEDRGLSAAALVVNRVHPTFEVPNEQTLSATPELAPYLSNLARCSGAAVSDRARISSLANALDPAAVIALPMLEVDVHSLDGLTRIVDALLGSPVATSATPGAAQSDD